MKNTDPVQTYLKKEYPRFIAELTEYLALPSISAQKNVKEINRCVAWLVKNCKTSGLTTRLYKTAGNPIVVATTRPAPPRREVPERRGGAEKQRKPHFLLYGHYDVQPPEPLALWKTPPFEPTIRAGKIFARGACDNKGQHFAHLKAVEAYLKTNTPLPCDITFLIEGEEEVGSENLVKFLKENCEILRADGVVISDTGMPSLNKPAITYALRGIAALEISLRGPDRDLHSGLYGGSVQNPALALAKILGALHNKDGRVTVPGFYDGVQELSSEERQVLNETAGERSEEYCASLGVPCLFGERGFTHTEHTTIRPTLEVNGLTSGYQGEGTKTIIPSLASAKITMRLVPNQNPGKIIEATTQYLKKLCPNTVTIKIQAGHGAEPYLFEPTSKEVRAAERAIKKVFGVPPCLIREGGSIPIVNDFKKVLGLHSLLIGLAVPDDNVHSPNEKFELQNFKRGMAMSAELWKELARM